MNAPTDSQCNKAWDEIMRIAKAHCLIVHAYGRVATLALPAEQRQAGIREKCLRMHRMSESEEIGG